MTQSRLKELLHYDEDTGIFTVKLNTGGSRKVGAISGSQRKDGYVYIGLDKKHYLAHRLAWLYVNGEYPAEIDHINKIKNDNSILNLRGCNHYENCLNNSYRGNNTSDVAGVSYYKTYDKWMAYININKKRKTLGYFADKADAIQARLDAEVKHGYHINCGIK